jgi:hypothetical protein
MTMFNTARRFSSAFETLRAARGGPGDAGVARDSPKSKEVSPGLDERARALARWEDDGGRSARIDPRTD